MQLLKVGHIKSPPALGGTPESPTDRPMDGTLSDDKGKYSFKNVRPGTYRLRSHVTGGFIEHTNQVVVTADAAPAKPPQIDFQIAPLSLLTTPEGALWFFGNHNCISRHDSNGFTNFPASMIKSDHFHGMARATDGVIWFGGRNLGRYYGKEFKAYTTNDGLADPHIAQLAAGPNGSMWFGGFAGTAMHHDGKTFASFTGTNGLDGSVVAALLVETNGTAWIGTESGVARYDPGSRELTSVTIKVGRLAQLSAITKIYRDDDGVFWFGTSGGVTRFDGTIWSSLDARDWPTPEARGGLAGNSVNDILPGQDGAVWFQTEIGVVRYQRSRTRPATPRVKLEITREDLSFKAILARTGGLRVRVGIQAEVVDFKSRPENRFFRCKMSPGRVPLADLEEDTGWSPPQREARFEMKPEVAGLTSPRTTTRTWSMTRRKSPPVTTVPAAIPSNRSTGRSFWNSRSIT